MEVYHIKFLTSYYFKVWSTNLNFSTHFILNRVATLYNITCYHYIDCKIDIIIYIFNIDLTQLKSTYKDILLLFFFFALNYFSSIVEAFFSEHVWFNLKSNMAEFIYFFKKKGHTFISNNSRQGLKGETDITDYKSKDR